MANSRTDMMGWRRERGRRKGRMVREEWEKEVKREKGKRKEME